MCGVDVPEGAEDDARGVAMGSASAVSPKTSDMDCFLAQQTSSGPATTTHEATLPVMKQRPRPARRIPQRAEMVPVRLLLTASIALLPAPNIRQIRPRCAAIRMDAEPDSLAAGAAEKAVLLKRGGAPGSVREGITTLLEALERESTSAEDTRKVWDAFVLAHKLHRNQLRRAASPTLPTRSRWPRSSRGSGWTSRR